MMDGEVNRGYLPDEERGNRNGIPNGTSSEKKSNLSLEEGASFVLDRGKTNEIQVKPKENSEDKEPEEKPEEEAVPPVGFFALFRYSSCFDKVLIFFGTLIAIISGCSMPGVMIVFGQNIDQMIDFTKNNSNVTKEDFLANTAFFCMLNAVFGGVIIACNYVLVSFFSLSAANQAFRIRCRFMQAVLKQDIAWFDTHKTGDFATRITGDLTRVEEGMGEKVGICLSFISSTLLCVGCGLYYGWKLALVILSVTPVLTIAMAIVTKIQATVSSQEMEAYGTAGAVAEEVISSIRTVVAFGGQQKEIDRFEGCLIPASRKGLKRGLLTAIGSAVTWFTIFAGYALAFWYGVRLILQDRGQEKPEYTGGVLIIVFFNVMSGSMFIGQTAPYFEAFALARGAAAKVFSIIDREPSIDSSSPVGLRPTHLEGHIRLKDVHFNYPARPTIQILAGLSLEVKPGETVALVGPSGCGKSTIIQLILRFYDTDSGSVELDDRDVKDLNLGWLRDQIGLVGQEPVLFSTTIEENIRMGRSDATTEEIIQAAKTANAHNFIDGLPMKYQTTVGERGTQLSGGQKQRIAIARALVRNPKILLLDEATSALDTESESVVQAALDEARRGRTTIIVAHRLSTIRTADKIVVLDSGVVKETGTHEELMEAKGLYYNLVVTQTKVEEDDDDDDNQEKADDVLDLERRTSVLSATSEEAYHRPSIGRQVSAFSRQTSTFSTKEKEDIKEEEEEVDTSAFSQSRLLKMTAPEWPYAVFGAISAIAMGIHFPAFGVIFGGIVGVLGQPEDEIQNDTIFYCLIFVAMAFSSGFFNFFQIFLFSVAGEKLTFRLRKMVFANIITQDITFFDDSKNGVGSLCSRLNSDASSVQGATGSRISVLLQAASTLVVSIFISFYFNWKIGLVAIAFIPLVLLGTALETRVVSGHMQSEKKGMEAASKIATEAIESIRTVASLHQEDRFYNEYHAQLIAPHKKSKLKSHVRGVVYGFAQGVTPLAYAASMYYGSRLVASDELEYADLLKVVEGVLVGAMMVGQAAAFAPDYEKARISAVRIFQLLDLKPVIDAFSCQGTLKSSIKGVVDFSNVQFSYPTRPQIRVLKGLSASVQPGQTVALVGSSGCGKSTCIQLLERFYDPTVGEVKVDSDDIRDLNISNHRSHLALVSQEPVLFGRTIAQNIAYGDNTRQPDMYEIISAARQANIHQFVTSLPQGYDTPVGDRGTQLSGGQKQRIAIARALIRNPRILLLDEATSALDAESEKVVQEALDLASHGRTCLVIAHRLTTIQNADLILVLHRGRIVEKGTHQELINKKGFYYGLHNTQGQVEKQ